MSENIEKEIRKQINGALYADVVIFYVKVILKALNNYPVDQILELLKTITIDEIRLLYNKLPSKKKEDLIFGDEMLYLPLKTQKTAVELLNTLRLEF